VEETTDTGHARPRAAALGAVAPATIALSVVCGLAAAAGLVLLRAPGTPYAAGSMSLVAWALAGGWLAAHAVLLAVTDARTHRLPDRLHASALVLLVPLLVLAALAAGEPSALVQSLACGLLPLVVVYLAALAAPGSVGLGDAKLLLVLGLGLGSLSVGAAVAGPVIGVVLAGLVSLVGVLTRRIGARSHVPLGPPLVVGAALATALALAAGS
jgi:leader peptidase (prepilin peptidase)/N-methyltransferase